MTDTTNEPGDTLEDNVRYLLENCPFTVRDLSGDRTGMRGREDLAGSLAITFGKMQGLAIQANRPRGTDAQILKERELTCAAIAGAVAFGFENTNPPPEPGHWLAGYWQQGRDAARAFAIADQQMFSAMESFGSPVGDAHAARYRGIPHGHEDFAEAVEWLEKRGYIVSVGGDTWEVVRRPGEPS